MVSYCLIALLLLSVTTYLLIDLIVEFWWFKSIGYALYYTMREGYRDILFLSVTLFLTMIFYANFVLFTQHKKNHFLTALPDSTQDGPSFLRLSICYFIPFSLLLAIPISIPVYLNWETFLLFFFSTNAGFSDPVYGKDISYYLFKYPVYQLIQHELLITFAVLLAVIAFLYRSTYKKCSKVMTVFPAPARMHLVMLFVLVALLYSWSIILERIDLLFVSRHEPVFFGPGAVETNYLLPIIWLTFFSFLGAAFSIIYYIYRGKGRKIIVGFFLCFLVLTGVREISFIPEMIDRFLVKSNPMTTEKSNIQFHIDATLDAFNLSHVKQINYPVASTLTSLTSAKIANELSDIPLWDNSLLQQGYEQLQTIRPFYTFSKLSADRYPIKGRTQQVNIAARELSTDKLPNETKSWENNHLIYTHGYGLAMSLSTHSANQPVQWVLKDISMVTADLAFKVEQPEIYYGTEDYLYAIVPNNAYSNSLATSEDFRTKYQGKAGVTLSSFIRRLIFSSYFGDKEISLSLNLKNNSQILIRRNIIERIDSITPFLQLDPEPYPVIVNNRIYWIVDAYTTSKSYPAVAPIDSPLQVHEDLADLLRTDTKKLNYIRNSVKIIIDAYDGSIDFYISDNKDPIIKAYSRAYPSLFKGISEMPKPFIKHLNYPKTLFKLQMQIYARYHQNKPEVFYQQSDRLEFSRIEDKVMQPYYLTIDPLDINPESTSEQQKFVLLNMLSPIERDNLSMIMAAGCLSSDHCDEQYKADIYAYKMPMNVQVDGPAQISALIDQTPEISEQITLWGQRGSKVVMGRIIIMPVEGTVLYIQPVYLAATSETGFPQLSKVIVAMNHRVVMDDSLELAFKKLEQKVMSHLNTNN